MNMTNYDNLDPIKRNIKPIKRQQSLNEILKEGEALLKQDEIKQNKVMQDKKVAPTQQITSNNPYLIARNKILDNWRSKTSTIWKAKEIEEMELTKNINNRHYDDFVHEVAMLGDTLS